MKKLIILLLVVLSRPEVAPAAAGQTAEPAALFEQPVLMTSAGQNAELQIAAVLAKRAGLTYTVSKLAGPRDLQGNKTLVLVLGASLKGLGAAGLDMAKEKERVAGLLEACRKNRIPILCLHLGGESRRGQQTDELIKACLPSAAAAVAVKSGNSDKLFSHLLKEKSIPLIEIDKAADALEPLKKLFKF